MIGKIAVGHVLDPVPDGFVGVYCGRAMPRKGIRDNSPLGNPFKGERLQAIERFRAMLSEIVAGNLASPELREIERLTAMVRSGQSILLQCWCRHYPAMNPPCHCDVIADVIRKELRA